MSEKKGPGETLAKAMTQPLKGQEDYGTAEQIRATVAETQARRAATAQPVPIAPLIPMSNDDAGIAAAASAEAMLLEMDAAIGVVDEERWAKLNETYHVFVRCRAAHKPGRSAHAIYLKEYPRSTTIPYDGWFARKVKEDAGAAYYPLKVYCQACLLDGTTMPLDAARVTSAVGDLEVDARWLWRRPKDPARARVEGETRVFPASLESQNIGRRNALAASRKAGYEVYDE